MTRISTTESKELLRIEVWEDDIEDVSCYNLSERHQESLTGTYGDL